jgi:2-polyprenyl-3-methyl-5-hydroxy-6-metoxy-1,4-benzoquinol methylase
MTLRIDPEQNEIRALRDLTDWRRKRVLEIGCGVGRLTRRLARLGAVVDAIDPDAGLIRKARKALPPRFAERVRFKTGQAETLDYGDCSFETVVFAWAL